MEVLALAMSIADVYCYQLFYVISIVECWRCLTGVGAYLTSIETLSDDSLEFWRIVYDHMFNTLLLILLLNIVFGVVIDTFAGQPTSSLAQCQ